jgi:hypothetical protein
MRLRKLSRTTVILTGLAILLGSMLASQGWAYQSLQEVYNNAGPGGGYDKLLELDPAVEYGGDLSIPSGVTVCIHGKGAKIFGLSSPNRAIQVYGSGLDIDHCVFVGDDVGNDALYFDTTSYGEVINNTIVDFRNAGIKVYYYNVSQGLRVENNIVIGCAYGVYAEENYEPTYIAYNDFRNNGYNYAHYCPG